MLSKMSEYGKSLIKTSLFWLKMKNCSKHVGKYWIKLAMQKGFDGFVVLLKSVSYLNEEKEDHQFVTDCISFHELEWTSVTVV